MLIGRRLLAEAAPGRYIGATRQKPSLVSGYADTSVSSEHEPDAGVDLLLA